MNNESVYADLYVHLHADRLMQASAQLEKTLSSTLGVNCVHFGDECRQVLYVAYDPRQITAEHLMATIRRDCRAAAKVANIITRLSTPEDGLH
jgi:hypothetical protein